MKILNAKICSNGQIFDGEVTVDGERIASVTPKETSSSSDETIIDAKGMYVIPGLLDVHFHGCVGYDTCDASKEAFDKIAEYEGSEGVLAICPATMTYPEDKLSEIMDIAADYESPVGADFVGLHLEGPFINPNRVGAQNSDYVQKPDADMLLRLQERAKGRIRICDVAPETENAIDFVEKIKDHVASVSIAHTCTDYDTAMQAFEHGANHLTHGFNAMPGIHHRKPGPLSAAADAEADVELICDNVHIHPSVVRLAFKLFTDEHVILISDTMRACGLEDGCYDLGGQQRASNFDNSRYKTFKLIYNMFGLIFGMMMIRELVLKMTGNEQADTFIIVLFGLVAVVFLYIGMIGMDKSNKKKFHNIYGKMVGIKFSYEIDAENIIITDEENDSDTFSWNDIVKWNQDSDNIYLFVGDDNCLVVSKKGFTHGSADDLRQLADAVIGMRDETGNSKQ